MTLSFGAHAQGVEINPAVKWKFVISHDLTFESGNFIMYEFPAEKNYDYIFNITHNQDSLHAVIMVYDLQDGLQDKMILDNNQLSIDLPFRRLTIGHLQGHHWPHGSKWIQRVTHRFSIYLNQKAKSLNKRSFRVYHFISARIYV